MLKLKTLLIKFVFILMLSVTTAQAQLNHIPVYTCENLIAGNDLFISELYDSPPNTGVTGAIELFNPTSQTIVLDGVYTIERASDPGEPVTVVYQLTGSVAPLSAYLMTIDMAVCSSVISDFSLTQGINANDEIILKKNGLVIDESRGGPQVGYTIIRKPEAVVPSAVYNADDWDISNTPSCANLGIQSLNFETVAESIISQKDLTICENGNGFINVIVTNPTTANYQWKKLDVNNNWVIVADGNGLTGSDTFQLDFANDIHTGQYYLTINYFNCQLISDILEVNLIAAPNVDVVVNHPACGSATGSVTITPLDGQNYQYRLNNGTYQTNNILTGAQPGFNLVTIMNEYGCTYSQTVLVNNPPFQPDVPIVQVIQPTCQLPTGTIAITHPIQAGYTYSVNGVNYSTNYVFQNLASGNYTVSVMAPSGCTSETLVTIDNFEADDNIDFNVIHGCVATTSHGNRQYIVELEIPSPFTEDDLEIRWKEASGYVFLENEKSFDIRDYLRNRNLQFVPPMTFSVEVITPQGCSTQEFFTIDGIVCDIPKGLSPNGDGLNDTFDLTGLSVANLTIFNRYGTEVYRYVGFYNNQWMGQDTNGNMLPTGTYFYQIIKFDGTVITGYVQLVTQVN